mgnify:CR=1 FL=1
MKCHVCNKKNKSGTGICVHCGAKLPIDTSVSEDSRNVVDSYKLRISKPLLIGIISVAVIVLSILIYLMVRPKKDSSGQIINDQNKITIKQKKQSGNVIITQNKQTTQETETVENTTKKTEAIKNEKGKVLTAVVKEYRLRIRSRPSLRSAIVDHLPKGAEVVIIAKTNKVKIRVGSRYLTGVWYKIKWEKDTKDGKVKTVNGWVWSSYLEIKK